MGFAERRVVDYLCTWGWDSEGAQEEVEDKKWVWIRGLKALGTRRCNKGWHKFAGGGGGGGVLEMGFRMPKVENF